GALVGAWGFGAHAVATAAPDTRTLAQLRAGAGWRRLGLRREGRQLLQPGGALLDLSAIAKGYAVDAVIELLRARGITAALVDVGGELRGHGRKIDGSPWRVLVDAGDEDADPCVVALDGVAIATSGPRWHRYEADGRELSHTIDPRTGAPVADAPVAVGVIAAAAVHADAWATALTVMGVEAGAAFAAERGLAARLVPAGDGATQCTTPAFDACVL